ncbi:hypothetical protein BDW22DRAFT_4608 [Trametopsis cervina]|nr:hypothetical protein BDW22DRAFT_4608 [Trametopsis cervina]
MAQGFMLVLASIGSKVDPTTFHDWYDNEHIPLRYDVPAFLTFQRWHAAPASPSSSSTTSSTDAAGDANSAGDTAHEYEWAAAYDLTRLAALAEPPYTTLTAQRSMRELLIFRDIGAVEQRLYDAYSPPGLNDAKGEEEADGTANLPPPSPHSGPATTFLLESADLKDGQEAAYARWMEEDRVPKLSRTKGWVRSRRFVLREFRRVGRDGERDGRAPPHRFLAVHEFGEGYAGEGEGEGKGEVVREVVEREEVRRWEMHKSFQRP